MFNFSDLSAAAVVVDTDSFAAAAAAAPAPRNLYRIVVNRPYDENCWGTSSATVQVHGTSPENAREHAIALVNDDEICWSDLDPEFECTGGDGYDYDSASADDEVELLGDSEDADWDTPDEEEEAAVAPAVAGPVAAAGPVVVDTDSFAAAPEAADGADMLDEAHAADAAAAEAETEAEAETDCEQEPEPATD